MSLHCEWACTADEYTAHKEGLASYIVRWPFPWKINGEGGHEVMKLEGGILITKTGTELSPRLPCENEFLGGESA
jgi:hypothetical protein